jgi:hypothetical protein
MRSTTALTASSAVSARDLLARAEHAAAAAVDDAAERVDHGDVRAGRPVGRQRAEEARQLHDHREAIVLARVEIELAPRHALGDLVAERLERADRVDEAGGLGRVGLEVRDVDQRLDGGGRQLALGGDDVDHRLVAAIEDRADRLLHLPGRRVAGQRLGRALVRAHVQEVGLDAELVEQRLDVHRQRGRSADRDAAERRDADPLARREHQVRRVARALDVARQRLAGLAQIVERGAQLDGVGLADLDGVDPDQHAGQLVVGRELAQPRDQRVELGAAAAGQRERLALDDAAVEREHAPVRLGLVEVLRLVGRLVRPGLRDRVGDLRERGLEIDAAEVVALVLVLVLVLVVAGLRRAAPRIARGGRLLFRRGLRRAGGEQQRANQRSDTRHARS